jgi:hypothetical protein
MLINKEAQIIPDFAIMYSKVLLLSLLVNDSTKVHHFLFPSQKPCLYRLLGTGQTSFLLAWLNRLGMHVNLACLQWI